MSQIINPVLFDGVDLNIVAGVTILRTDPYRPPRRSLSMSVVTRTNKSKVNSGFYVERTITVHVGISRATRALVEQSLDSLMQLVQGLEKPLVFLQSDTLRKYYATLSDAPIGDMSGGSYLELDLVFDCSDRYGYDLAPTLLLSMSGYTSANRSDGLIFAGSAEWQLPMITVTYVTITDGTAKTVTVGNSQTGQQVAVTRTWVPGDVLTVGYVLINNSYEPSVKVNGVETDFVGAIPEWRNGPGYWYYSDTFTARSFNGSITQVRRYV